MLLNNLPGDVSAFKAAQRGGRWPDWKQMLADSLTEQYRMHATYNLIHWGDEGWFDAEEFAPVDPALQAERAAEAAAEAAEAAEEQRRFESEAGYS